MAVTAPAAAALLSVLGAIITAPGFDVFAVAWVPLFKSLTNILIIASYSGLSGYLLKNLLTDKNQNVLGIPTQS